MQWNISPSPRQPEFSSDDGSSGDSGWLADGFPVEDVVGESNDEYFLNDNKDTIIFTSNSNK